MATTAVGGVDHFLMMSRPQIGIDRLPVRRPSTNEPKEAMNCKSCRKRKIKCNRVKPSCEACVVFNCACIYDAVPKKRGPKTDVLEALLKRVNGLEKRLKDEKKSDSSEEGDATSSAQKPQESEGSDGVEVSVESSVPPETPREQRQAQVQLQPVPAQLVARPYDSTVLIDALVDTFFNRLHGRPYHILDEPATRQRLRDGLLPSFLVSAVRAVSIRYASHLCGGHSAAVKYSQDYAAESRAEIDVDEPTIEHLQALLLLAMASFQSGKGKKSYMLLTHAISMAFALNLHRELPSELRIAPSEREGRRKLFWTCYLMDRFTVTGSRRPSLISDESLCLRLPAWLPHGSHIWVDGNFFPNGSSLPYATGVSNAGQGSAAMLVEIVRILGVTNRYLAAGGVKGDSHFPWHAQSTLSRIRSDLDYWAANTSDAFASVEALFSRVDSSTLILSKLVYHLIICLIYRPFLPVDLAELSGAGQHQSWQIEATNLCFLHANAITELVEIGKSASIVDWPSFVAYCVCTAGTIHVHGAHYVSLREGDVFSNSVEFLSREFSQLSEHRVAWAGAHHQHETLQTVYSSHSQLVKSLATSPMRFSPVFQMEDFFDRYPGSYIDGAHVTFTDVDFDLAPGPIPSQTALSQSMDMWRTQTHQESNASYQPMVPSQYMTQNQMPPVARKAKRRRTTDASSSYPYPRSNGPTSATQDRRQTHETFHPPLPSEKPIRQAPPTLQRTNTQPDMRTGIPASNGMSTVYENNNGYMATPPVAAQTMPSPNFGFSPPQDMINHTENGNWDPFYGMQSVDHQTPSGVSQSAESAHTDLDKDPFLSLLEQLAQNDGSANGGPSDLDFFLNSQS